MGAHPVISKRRSPVEAKIRVRELGFVVKRLPQHRNGTVAFQWVPAQLRRMDRPGVSILSESTWIVPNRVKDPLSNQFGATPIPLGHHPPRIPLAITCPPATDHPRHLDLRCRNLHTVVVVAATQDHNDIRPSISPQAACLQLISWRRLVFWAGP